MIEAIETRELITLEGPGAPVRCTYHKPRPELSTSGPAGTRMGVLFVNSFSTPRAWYGDTAVSWADSLASLGYPCFRIDLPGLGDSSGETPAELLDYINDGGHSAIASAKAKEIVSRFRLAGLVLVGHCAGAITAIYAASERKECTGLVLMEPYFHLTRGLKPKLRLRVGNWASRSKVGAGLTRIYAQVREMRRRLRSNAPPGNANLALLGRWKQVASSGTPVLILKAQPPGVVGANLKPGQFDYLKHVVGLAGRDSKVLLRFVEDADHCFADQTGRSAVCTVIGQWLGSTFAEALSQSKAQAQAQTQYQAEAKTPLVQTLCSPSPQEDRELKSRYLPA